MGKSKTLSSIVFVTISNVSTIISGLFVGFLLPKIISLDGYGFYKTFTLYASYIGLFTLGLHDGIILEYGGTNYEDFDKKKFRSLFRWYCLINLFFSSVILFISVFVLQGEYRVIFFLLAFDIMANNITGYFQQLSQITQRFTEYSMRKIITSLINVISIGIMYAYYKCGHNITYLAYIVFFVLCNFVMSIWYIYTYKEIVFGESYGLMPTKQDAKKMIVTGLPLTIANLCASFILTLDRQFVSILFPNSTYAIYAFAYNMLSLVTVATSAVSTVLYPFLKRTNAADLKKSYTGIVSTLLVFVSCAMLAFFPLKEFVKFFLPKYGDSIVIFRIIFPGLGISTVITVAMHNYYKTIGKNLGYFKKSVGILVLSAVANGIAYAVFKTTASISVASIITMLVWYLAAEQEFVKTFAYHRWKNFSFLVLYMCGFYIISSVTNSLISGIAYLLFITVLILAFYHKEIKTLIYSRNKYKS